MIGVQLDPFSACGYFSQIAQPERMLNQNVISPAPSPPPACGAFRPPFPLVTDTFSAGTHVFVVRVQIA